MSPNVYHMHPIGFLEQLKITIKASRNYSWYLNLANKIRKGASSEVVEEFQQAILNEGKDKNIPEVEALKNALANEATKKGYYDEITYQGYLALIRLEKPLGIEVMRTFNAEMIYKDFRWHASRKKHGKYQATDVISKHVEYGGYSELAGVSKVQIAENLDAVKDYVASAHKKYPKVEIDLIYALICFESKGLQKAISQTGAIGIMQLTSGNYAPKNDEKFNPFKPEPSIMKGVSLLNYYMKKYGSNDEGVIKTLAAYNQGGGTIDKAIKEAKEADKEASWISYLPTNEGRNYPAEVLEFFSGKGGIPGYFGD